jgi:hypothetical protein
MDATVLDTPSVNCTGTDWLLRNLHLNKVPEEGLVYLVEIQLIW